jgi:hypothetical protein
MSWNRPEREPLVICAIGTVGCSPSTLVVLGSMMKNAISRCHGLRNNHRRQTIIKIKPE